MTEADDLVDLDRAVVRLEVRVVGVLDLERWGVLVGRELKVGDEGDAHRRTHRLDCAAQPPRRRRARRLRRRRCRRDAAIAVDAADTSGGRAGGADVGAASSAADAAAGAARSTVAGPAGAMCRWKRSGLAARRGATAGGGGGRWPLGTLWGVCGAGEVEMVNCGTAMPVPFTTSVPGTGSV